VISFTLPVLIGIFKFGLLTSYHTWSVKIAVAVTIISYLLLFSETLDWPFKVAAAICIYAAVEQIAITLIMRHEHVDVRTLWQALALNKLDNGKQS
jgi:CDP-diacylglycerol--glycerol-3-phosphate 3-phosphatidyltransferase